MTTTTETADPLAALDAAEERAHDARKALAVYLEVRREHGCQWKLTEVAAWKWAYEAVEWIDSRWCYWATQAAVALAVKDGTLQTDRPFCPEMAVRSGWAQTDCFVVRYLTCIKVCGHEYLAGEVCPPDFAVNWGPAFWHTDGRALSGQPWGAMESLKNAREDVEIALRFAATAPTAGAEVAARANALPRGEEAKP